MKEFYERSIFSLVLERIYTLQYLPSVSMKDLLGQCLRAEIGRISLRRYSHEYHVIERVLFLEKGNLGREVSHPLGYIDALYRGKCYLVY